MGVLPGVGVEFKPALLDAGAEALGINISSGDFPFVRSLVGADSRVVGWFGYESNSPLGPRLSIWFYCDRSANDKTSAQKTVRTALEKAGFKAGPFQEDGFNIGIFCNPEHSPGDKEWFTGILKAFRQ